MNKNLVRTIYERDWYRCRACGFGRSLQIHHILFRSQGGPDKPENLVLLCKACHDAAHGIGGSILREDLQCLVTEGRHKLGRH